MSQDGVAVAQIIKRSDQVFQHQPERWFLALVQRNIFQAGVEDGLIKKQGVFLRTPKQRGRNTFLRSMRVIEQDLMWAVLCLGVLISIWFAEAANVTIALLTGLLIWQAFIYATAFIVSQWSWRSEALVSDPLRRLTFRTTGEQLRNMITTRRAAFALLSLVAGLVILFSQAIKFSPEEEKIYRTNPEAAVLIPHSLVRNPPESYIAAKIFMEEHRWPSAIEHFIAAKLYAEAKQVICRVGPDLLRMGKWTTVSRWIDSMPGKYRLADSNMLLLQAESDIYTGRVEKVNAELLQVLLDRSLSASHSNNS